ncbi:MAG: NrfD/PsrC family molybdoenzyme membrane anchor subunit, partial [Deltaproteobacteria bacterium]|nr:NrfD/PsrC family molybdoenzyme membrane anchor subunit [Deltaproteobacteria bacterium]
MSTTTTAEMSITTTVESEPPFPTEVEDVPRFDQRLLLAAIPLTLLVLVAAYFYFVQISRGIGLVAGLNRPVFWGLYLVNCIFFVGVSTGGVVIASLVHAFGRMEFKPIARIAELMAISATVMATASLFVNLCWPTRMFYILRYPHPTSPIFWDMVNITLYMFISLTYAYLGTRADLARVMHAKPQHAWLYRLLTLGYTDLSVEARRRDQRLLRMLAVAVLFTEVAVQTVSAWLFGLQKAQPGWFGGMMAPLFIVFAVVSGLAVLTVSLVATKRIVGIAIEHELVRKLGKIVLFLLPVLGYFLFVEMVTVLYSAEPARLDVYRAMMFGLYAPVFWGHLVLGLIFPILLLTVILYGVSQRTIWLTGIILLHVLVGLATWLDFPIPYKPLWPGLQVWAVYTIMGLTGLGLLSFCARASVGEDVRIGIAALLVAAGILAGRWNIVVPSLMDHSYLPYPLTQYIPTLKEFAVFLGIYALGALIYIACIVILPLLDREEAEIEIVNEER